MTPDGAPLCESVGTVFILSDPPKVQVLVENAIVAYARSLIPAAVNLNRTRYDPHITVVREEKVDRGLWTTAGKWHGARVQFQYDPRVVPGDVYWWLRVWSDEIIEFRRSMGLPDLSWACRPPDGEAVFHVTIGNLKGRT